MPKFNRSSGGIEWAKWSWNPVTGCKHGCPYCYARKITERFPAHYPKGFAPHLREDRLEGPMPRAPKEHGDRHVFVCSMADLFGDWVHVKLIRRVFDKVRSAPDWQFLFLTKNPAGMVGLDWPSNAWAGVTVDRQEKVRDAIDALSVIPPRVCWISCEPMLEPIDISSADIAELDWLVIGAQTNPDFQPDRQWVERLTERAVKTGVPVYHKPNLECGWLKEYPGVTS